MRHKEKRKSVSITVCRGFRALWRVVILFALIRFRFLTAAKRHRFTPSVRMVLGGVFVVVMATFILSALNPASTSAASGIESELSFEGKIVNSTGQNIPDGNYNMEFKIYSGCTNEPTNNTGCTAIWTEDYLTSTATYSTTSPVVFTSGTYQVNLGSICSFSGGSCEGNTNTAVNWDTYPLYLSLNIGTTAVCSTGNFSVCGSGDGAMNPYVLLTSTPYSFNSGELGGIAAAGFVQTAPTVAQTIQAAGNTTGLIVEQNAGGTYSSDIFDVQGTGGSSDDFEQISSSAANTGNVLLQGLGSSSTVGLQAGSGGTLTIGNQAASTANTIDIGSTTTNANADTVNIDTEAANTGSVTIGGTGAATGAITIGQSTGMNTVTIAGGATLSAATQTVNIGNGVTASGGALAINIGTQGASGSTSTITVGSTQSADTVKLQGGATSETISNSGDTVQTNSSNTASSSMSLVQNGSSSSTLALQNNATSSSFYLSDNASSSNALTVNSYTSATTSTATPTFVQQASVASAAAATSSVLAFGSNNTLGNTIIVAVSWNTVSSLTPTCSDSQGNTYSAIVLETDDPDNSQSGICYATNIKAGANTVTVTYGASVTYRALAIHEYSGIATTSPVDTDATNAATGTTTTNAYTSTTAATTTSGDLIFGYFVDETGSTATATAGTGFTQRTDNTTLTSPATTEDMVQSSVGSIAATQTENQAHAYTGMMMAFKPSTTTGSLTNTNANAMLSISQSGQTTFRNPINSTSALQVQNSSGNSVLNVNTNSGGTVTVTNNVSTASPAITTQTSGWEWDNYSLNSVVTSLAVSPHAVGDLMMFYYNFGQTGDTITSVSGGGVSNWHLAAGTNGDTYIYEGTVTSTGSSTIYITYSGNNTIYWDLLAAQEFSSAYGANTVWGVVAGSGPSTTPSSTTAVPFPSLTTTQANQMYWGAAAPDGGLIQPSGCPSGFSCLVTTGGDFIIYDSSTTANTAYAPVATENDDPSVSIGAIISANPASGTALSVSGSSQVEASSTSALQVQNTAGGSVFTVDTANDVITSGGNIIVSDNSNCNYTNYTSYISSLNPTAYWKLEDGGTSASDSSGNGDTGTLSGITAGITPGPFSCAPSHPAMAFSSGSSSSIQTPNTYVNPESYTETVMFKTTSYGPLIGFVNASTTNFDRLMYVGTNGELYAGIYPGTAESINSTQTVNNGVWQVYGSLTQSSAGLFLYLDGSLVASNATYTTAGTPQHPTGMLAIPMLLAGRMRDPPELYWRYS